MHRHQRWLRRRIMWSVATQTAATAAVAALVLMAVLWWRTDASFGVIALGSLALGQLVATVRLAHAVRSNPLPGRFLQTYLERPYDWQVEAADPTWTAPDALAGFIPAATVRGLGREPSPSWRVWVNEIRGVVASESVETGDLTLISALANGRALVTDSRLIPPHPELELVVAKPDHRSLLVAHRTAVAGRFDLRHFDDGPAALVCAVLDREHQAWDAVGPLLGPFLNPEPLEPNRARLVARLRQADLGTVELVRSAGA